MSNRKKLKKIPRIEVIESLHDDYAWLREQEIRLKAEEVKDADDAQGSNDLSVSG